MHPWQVKGNDNPTRWEKMVWYRRWQLWMNESNARQQRQIEEMELRRMQNGR